MTTQSPEWTEFERQEHFQSSESPHSLHSSKTSAVAKGKLKISNGIYYGELMKDPVSNHWVRHGHGKMTYFNNNSYVGEWNNDKFDGVGEYIWSDGRKYKGAFKSDKIEGKGTGFWPDGRIYEGEYREDLAHGHGLVTLPNGRFFEGVFESDFPIQGELIESDGTLFLATFDGKTHVSEWKTRTRLIVGKFEEEWEFQDKAKIFREFVWSDGRRFAGSCNGLCPVMGVQTEVDGTQYLVSYGGYTSFARSVPPAIKLRLKTIVNFSAAE